MTDTDVPRLQLPTFRILTGEEVLRCVDGDRADCLDVVRRAYLTHSRGDSYNPQSGFLRFPNRPNSRIISLPAYLGGEFDVAGIKWISSFPDNPARGIPRASAVLVLNDVDTGYPLVCMESSIVSATRTAASAVLGARELLGAPVAGRVGVIGTGLIAGHVWKFFKDLDWQIGGARLFDLRVEHAEQFATTLTADGVRDVAVVRDIGEAFSDCDLVVITTVASEPHIHDPQLLAHNPVVLHLSLRDLAPELILQSQNITDDIGHAVRERTSLELTEQQVGHRDFLHGTIADLLNGELQRDPGRPAIFSPFGLGVLDLAVGQWALNRITADGGGREIEDFYGHAVY